MKGHRLLCALLAAAMLTTSVTAPAPAFAAAAKQETAAAETKAKKLKGWVTKEGNTYYYVDGKPVTGWKKIKKKWYFFHKKTKALVKNQITGDKTKGYYYVDKDGISVTDSVMKLAVALVRKVTKSSMTQEQKLRAVYNYFIKKCSYKRYYHVKGDDDVSRMPGYARDMFKNRYGNCYRGASALLYCAKALGYETRLALGGMTSSSRKPRTRAGYSIHGWSEVKVGKKWLLMDISIQRRHNKDLFLIEYKKYPYYIYRDRNYLLNVENGKVIWSKEK